MIPAFLYLPAIDVPAISPFPVNQVRPVPKPCRPQQAYLSLDILLACLYPFPSPEKLMLTEQVPKQKITRVFYMVLVAGVLFQLHLKPAGVNSML